ncbi:hypothetical protein SAMN04489712_10442 [Thermomonospora echinospora]|uniref:Uncharacterized protein n=1 Tax=Thermomonospora echinospora TaxID=1992 RepID=A0A1H5YIX7_9ACTN|nr:hypothetical protein [Thermomonospora echinospora]SEG24083.1 hypothetical protein SAMN04489712_10442 [Thermomonospora echinospora]
MKALPDLAPIIGTLLAYGGLCLLTGLTLGYLLGTTRRERRLTAPFRPRPGRHARPPAHRRVGRGHPAAGRF